MDAAKTAGFPMGKFALSKSFGNSCQDIGKPGSAWPPASADDKYLVTKGFLFT